ncbi:hypothetical protein ACHAXA_003314 [Cyclostephanos tholiformis]|uniref:RNA helicase n=1 Tax=Cyclostephanos tholiformis TaxID=382380 RepID=A0ABD3SBU3_9STRA
MSNDVVYRHYTHERRILPIASQRTQILRAIELYGVLVLVGETGCGKSTQLPQYLYENGWTDGDMEVICTQPRRIAATSLAMRVSTEVDDPSIVGYSVRFDSSYVPGVTRIRYVTDGWLLRETTLLDPLLSRCSVLIIDEAHERSLNTELLLGAVKKIRRARPQLRIVICSATLDAESFLEYFVGGRRRRRKCKNGREEMTIKRTGGGEKNNDDGVNDEPRQRKRKSRWGKIHDGTTANDAEEGDEDGRDLTDGTIISVDGRQHPVDVMYVNEPVSDYVKSTVETALRILEEDGGRGGDGRDDDDGGDILCFLATGEEVDSAVKMAEDAISSSTTIKGDSSRRRKRGNDASCLPLYSSLPPNVQSQVFLPRSTDEVRRGKRRIIFATNIAEASVTVPNVAHVIDCGYAKMPFFDPYSGFDRLIVCPISRASARQRAGRAGRVRPGRCYRLYSEDAYDRLEAETAPEVQRCELTTLIMTIKALGVKNVLSFDLMSVPTVEALSHGLESLYALGALDESAELTDLGMEMVYFPTDVRTSRMLLASLDMERREDTPPMISKLIVADVLTVSAVLQVKDLFRQPRTEGQWRSYDNAMADVLDRSGDHVTSVHLFDLVDHSGKILSEDECRDRFVNRAALVRAFDVRDQLSRFLRRRFGGNGGSSSSSWFGPKRREIVGSRVYDPDERSEAIRKCVTAGYFTNAARLGDGGRYYSLRGNYAVSVSPSSVLHRYGESSEYIVFGRTYDGSRGGVDAKPCSSVNGLWLRQLAPHYWS